MPQILHPSFLRIGRRSAAVLLAFAALGLLVTGLARPADASDPYVAGSDATRTTRLSDAQGAPVADRAAGHGRLLGVTGTVNRTVDRVVDRRGHRTFDEVTGTDADGRPVEVLRYTVEGRLIGASRLGWRAGGGPTLAGTTDAVRAADRLARAVGIVPDGQPAAAARGSSGWNVRWSRAVKGVPVPGDGLRVQLWDDGSFHGLTVSEHSLAPAPATPIAGAAATATVDKLLDRWIPSPEPVGGTDRRPDPGLGRSERHVRGCPAGRSARDPSLGVGGHGPLDRGPGRVDPRTRGLDRRRRRFAARR